MATRVLAIAEIAGIHGRRDELVAALRRLEAVAAGEAGCRRYTFAATLADPDTFVLVSEWDTREALDGHHRSDAFGTFQRALDGLLAQPSTLTIHAVEGTVRPLDVSPLDPRDAD